MNYLRSLIVVAALMLISACGDNSTGEFTTVKVKQVEQVAGYTYLLVKAKGPEYWVAVTTMEASAGDTYHYKGGMVMQDFHSKELDKTFNEVVFIEALLTEVPASVGAEGQSEVSPIGSANPHGDMDAASQHGTDPQAQGTTPGSKIRIEKSDIAVEAGEGCISIAELYANRESYDGKSIRVKGEVTKFNPSIMDRNWVHIQDGTEHGGKFDLTLTSPESFEVGTIVTVEGTLALDRDFGYGYSYELLVEEAKAVQ
jgi:GW (Gly-Tryp) dipeptide domain